MRSTSDFQQARRMAGLLGFEHRAVLFSFGDYLAAIPATIQAGESFTDSVPQYLVFQAIGRDFRVALNGEGADEVFGGYPGTLVGRPVRRAHQPGTAVAAAHSAWRRGTRGARL